MPGKLLDLATFQKMMDDLHHKILQAIEESDQPIVDPDLCDIQQEYITFINEYLSNASGCVYQKAGENDPEVTNPHADSISTAKRYVIIGDLHCDFEALKGILLKLLKSDYDYFNHGVFVFMGDYLDRGFKPFQTLRLLFRLYRLLGRRCIFLKGNHDGFYFDRSKEEFYPKVKPAETISRMFQVFEPATMEKFSTFFEMLPYFALVDVQEKSYFITHGGIPKDCYRKQVTLEKLGKFRLPFDHRSGKQSGVCNALTSMTWADPSGDAFIYDQHAVRFQFGSAQFERFRKSFGFTHMVRGHEPEEHGFKSYYDDRLFTVFSTGGRSNPASYYSGFVREPAFAIIDEGGNFRQVSIFSQGA